MKIMKILRTEVLGFKFTGSYKKIVCSNTFRYSEAVKSSKKFASHYTDNKKPLQYYKLTDYQVHILLRLQDTSIH